MGGVAYLSLEDSEVCSFLRCRDHELSYAGTIHSRNKIPRYAAHEALPGHGAAVRRGENSGRISSVVCHSQVSLIIFFATMSMLTRISYQPAPFFVLDEVDAALDNTNVAKIANYIRSQASETFQFIVISLKGSLYERGNSLVGIYRDQDVNSSRTLTLDVRSHSSAFSKLSMNANFDIAHSI